MMADVSTYTSLIPSQHSDKPRYMAMVQTVCQCLVDGQNVILSLPSKFDINKAVGAQLDDVGLWVGLPRTIRTPLPDVFFTLDSNNLDLGLDAGIWWTPVAPEWGVSQWDDSTYRLLLIAKIHANGYKGTLPEMVDILREIFSPATVDVVEGNMTVNVTITGTPPSSLFKFLVLDGYLPLQPAGISVTYHFS
jgi:hypothetical protein